MKSASLERRIISACCDALLFTLYCAVLTLRFVGVPIQRLRHFEAAAIVVILATLAIEALTGLTPGRLMTGLRIAREEGHRPRLQTLLMRTAIKALPFLLFLLGWWAHSPLADLCWWTAAVVVQFYATWYYFAIARRDRSPFDLPVGTKIVPSGEWVT